MALGSTHLLREMSTSDISWGQGGPCLGLKTLPLLCVNCHEIREPHLLEASGLSKPVQGLLHILLLTKYYLGDPIKKNEMDGSCGTYVG